MSIKRLGLRKGQLYFALALRNVRFEEFELTSTEIIYLLSHNMMHVKLAEPQQRGSMFLQTQRLSNWQ